MYEVGQQYGVKPEIVPKELDSTHKVIYLNEVSPELKALLFRDIGLGDGLVTKEIAKTFEEGLAQLVHESNERLKSRLTRLRKQHAG